MDEFATPTEWHPNVLHHPGLKPVEKMLFHLMMPLGGDTPGAARQAAQQLGIGNRYARQLRARLRALGCFQSAPEGRNPKTEDESNGTPVPEPPCQNAPGRNPGAENKLNGTPVPEPPCRNTPERNPGAENKLNGTPVPEPPCRNTPERNSSAENRLNGTPVPEPRCPKAPERNPSAASHESLNARYSKAFEENSTTKVLKPPLPPPRGGGKPTEPAMGQNNPPDPPSSVDTLAAELLQAWDQAFPKTTQGASTRRDQKALVALLTQHGKTPAEIHGYIAHLRDQHKISYWPRPACLTEPSQRGQGPLVFALIETQIDALKESPHGTHRLTRQERTAQRNTRNQAALAHIYATLQKMPDALGRTHRLAAAGGA